MSKRIRYILVFLILALIAAVAAWIYIFRESKPDVASRKTEITIDAPKLLRDFEINEDSANLKYVNKIVQVTGTVSSIAKDNLGYSVYLKEKDAISGIVCSFDVASFDSLRILPGAIINVKGICMGYLMDVQMNKCSFTE
jgi:hypothetical protein